MAEIFHVLNGDSLRQKFPDTIDGTIVVFRECLIEGPIVEGHFEEFFNSRSDYMQKVYDISEKGYHIKSIKEISQLLEVTDGNIINLWFEHDLFCQVKLWYTINLLSQVNSHLIIKIIYPLPLEDDNRWYGFGATNPDDLLKCLEEARTCTDEDKEFALTLWKAYANNNNEDLKKLSLYSSPTFPESGHAIQAHLDRIPTPLSKGRPQERLLELIEQHGTNNFGVVFQEFQKTEGIYGFGDLQVKSMFDKLI